MGKDRRTDGGQQMTDDGNRVGDSTSHFLEGFDQGQVMVQEGKDFGRVLGVRGEVDDRSGQAFGHGEIGGLKPPALQAGLNWVQGGTEPVAQGDPGLFGRRREGWAIGGSPFNFTDFCFEWKSVKDRMTEDGGVCACRGGQLRVAEIPWGRFLPIFALRRNR